MGSYARDDARGARGAMRWPAVGLALLTASVLLALAAPGDARAVTGSSPCAGRQVRTLSFTTGSVHVYRGNGYVCAFTVQKNPGTRRQMSISVQARGGRPVKREGRLPRRVGPVTVYAGHRCVWVRGSVGRGSVSSGWILC